MKNLTDFLKTVETRMDPRLQAIYPWPSQYGWIFQGQKPLPAFTTEGDLHRRIFYDNL